MARSKVLLICLAIIGVKKSVRYTEDFVIEVRSIEVPPTRVSTVPCLPRFIIGKRCPWVPVILRICF